MLYRIPSSRTSSWNAVNSWDATLCRTPIYRTCCRVSGKSQKSILPETGRHHVKSMHSFSAEKRHQTSSVLLKSYVQAYCRRCSCTRCMAASSKIDPCDNVLVLLACSYLDSTPARATLLIILSKLMEGSVPNVLVLHTPDIIDAVTGEESNSGTLRSLKKKWYIWARLGRGWKKRASMVTENRTLHKTSRIDLSRSGFHGIFTSKNSGRYWAPFQYPGKENITSIVLIESFDESEVQYNGNPAVRMHSSDVFHSNTECIAPGSNPSRKLRTRWTATNQNVLIAICVFYLSAVQGHRRGDCARASRHPEGALSCRDVRQVKGTSGRRRIRFHSHRTSSIPRPSDKIRRCVHSGVQRP